MSETAAMLVRSCLVTVATLLTLPAFGAAAAGAAATPVQESDAVEGIAGTLRNIDVKGADGSGVPVDGVEIVVTDETGTKIGSVVSDIEGRFAFTLPGPGTYGAELQVDSLPSDVQLADPATAKRPFRVTPGQRKPIAFVLVRAEPFDQDSGASATSSGVVPVSDEADWSTSSLVALLVAIAALLLAAGAFLAKMARSS